MLVDGTKNNLESLYILILLSEYGSIYFQDYGGYLIQKTYTYYLHMMYYGKPVSL